MSDEEAYCLYAKLNCFNRRLEKTRLFIADCLSRCSNPYVAWSGGKDSTVMLHLVMEQRPDIPAVCIQSELDNPDNIEMIERATKELGVNLILIHPEASPWEILEKHGGPFGQVNVASSELDKKCFYEPINKAVKEHGFDAAFIGLRAEESRSRLMNRRVRGLSYRQKAGMQIFTPLADWTGRDIFAYTVTRELPMNKVYSKTKFHPEPERIREGWWLPGDLAAARGGVVWLKYYYPDKFRELQERFPEVAREA